MRRLAIILAVLVTVATACFRIDGARLLDLADSPDPSAVVRTDGSLVVFTTQTPGYRIRRTTFDVPDANPSDGICGGQLGGSGKACCSLRAAVQTANEFCKEGNTNGCDQFFIAMEPLAVRM